MNIQNIALTDIHPYAHNPRKNDEAVNAVAASIREFGFLVPLVIDRGHEIVAGHTRYRAAKALGMKEVPCVIADELTEDQIKAFRLADNKVGELATWDMDLLPLELADIVMPMTDFGFEVISEDEFGDSFTLDAGEKKPFQQISITVHDEQAKLILAAIKYIYDHKAVTETFTNENHNGNGLYEVVRECSSPTWFIFWFFLETVSQLFQEISNLPITDFEPLVYQFISEFSNAFRGPKQGQHWIAKR